MLKTIIFLLINIYICVFAIKCYNVKEIDCSKESGKIITYSVQDPIFNERLDKML